MPKPEGECCNFDSDCESNNCLGGRDQLGELIVDPGPDETRGRCGQEEIPEEDPGFVDVGGECSKEEDCIQSQGGRFGVGKLFTSYLIFLPFEIIFSVSISTTYLLPLLLLKNVM